MKLFIQATNVDWQGVVVGEGMIGLLVGEHVFMKGQRGYLYVFKATYEVR